MDDEVKGFIVGAVCALLAIVSVVTGVTVYSIKSNDNQLQIVKTAMENGYSETYLINVGRAWQKDELR